MSCGRGQHISSATRTAVSWRCWRRRGYPTRSPLPPAMFKAARVQMRGRWPWNADIPVDHLADRAYPKLVISGGHSTLFDSVCNVLEARLPARREVIRGAGHSIPTLGRTVNDCCRRSGHRRIADGLRRALPYAIGPSSPPSGLDVALRLATALFSAMSVHPQASRVAQWEPVFVRCGAAVDLPGRADGHGQEKSLFACSLKSRIGPPGPTSMKVTGHDALPAPRGLLAAGPAAPVGGSHTRSGDPAVPLHRRYRRAVAPPFRAA